MNALDRVVAGLSCRDVLHRLSPFLDGELPPAAVAQVEQHLAGCDTCARFGGHVGTLVQQLRGSLDTPPPVPPETAARVRRDIMARIGAR
jgi:anti-sigma factor RsiW